MNFNLDTNKQAQNVIFGRKVDKINHPLLLFNQNLVKSSSTQKHLMMILDAKLNFNLHLKNVQSKVNKIIGLPQKLQNILLRELLVTIYKLFVRPYLDYGDIVYEWAYNSSFHQNIESIQYSAAALRITGAIRGDSLEKTYQKLGFESLQKRRWFKTIQNKLPSYLFQIAPSSNTRHLTRSSKNIP